MRRVLAIYLDGYEQSLGQRFMAAGEMPDMARLAASSARYLLNHGPAQRTGLAGEHVATGLSPAAAQRWSQIHFDPRSYAVWQKGTQLRPFAADLKCRTIVFDAPYFDLLAAPSATGIVNWGAHDPGVAPASRPSELAAELNDRFGSYPASQWLYGFAWPSEEKARAMGSALARAVDVRAEAAEWLLSEKFPDWDFALIAVCEPHSAIEGFWYGIDSKHQLHQIPSAATAKIGIHTVYRAVDRLVGRLTKAFPDAITVAFAMGGMGVNSSDVPSMLLLPELLYRRTFRSAFFRQPQEWMLPAGACPLPPADTCWETRIAAQFPAAPKSKLRELAAQVLPERIKTVLRKASSSRRPWSRSRGVRLPGCRLQSISDFGPRCRHLPYPLSTMAAYVSISSGGNTVAP